MTNRIQWSNRNGDAILVIGGETAEEFFTNALGVLGADGADALDQSLQGFLSGAVPAASPTMETAVRTVQRQLGGQVIAVLDNNAGDGRFDLPTNQGPATLTDGQQKLIQRGFVFDKYERAWHATMWDIAPPCQCPAGSNKGKLALMLGKSRKGDFYRGWFCVNAFGKGSSAGCKSVFNDNYPNA
ncbi:hypothetical protein [Streptomyces anulatus]|uniref:hypothetical protein n=1 Tax=Streptomyces anulatus TaxID=1892 RepID=UPI00342B446E